MKHLVVDVLRTTQILQTLLDLIAAGGRFTLLQQKQEQTLTDEHNRIAGKQKNAAKFAAKDPDLLWGSSQEHPWHARVVQLEVQMVWRSIWTQHLWRPKSGSRVRSRPWKRGHQEISRDIKGSWGQSHRSYEEKSRQLLIFYATNRRTWKNRRVAHKTRSTFTHLTKCSKQRSFAPTEPHPALFCLFSHPESRNQEGWHKPHFQIQSNSWASCWAAHALLLESESCRVLTCWDALYVKGPPSLTQLNIIQPVQHRICCNSFWELFCGPIRWRDKHSLPLRGHAVLGSLSVFASETQLEKRDVHCESPSMIQMTSLHGLHSRNSEDSCTLPPDALQYDCIFQTWCNNLLAAAKDSANCRMCAVSRLTRCIRTVWHTSKIDSKLWVPGPRWHFSALVLSAWQKSREGHPICNMANLVTHEARKVTRECQSAQFVSGQIWSATDRPTAPNSTTKFPPDSWKANGRNLTSQWRLRTVVQNTYVKYVLIFSKQHTEVQLFTPGTKIEVIVFLGGHYRFTVFRSNQH